MSGVAKLVILTPKEDRRDELMEALEGIRARAAEEEGTQIWTIHTLREDPRRLYLYELYADQEASDLHEELPELGALLGRLDELLAEAPTLRILDLVAQI